MDFPSVTRALEGCYRAYVNTDGFTVKESDEIWAGIRIFELAHRVLGFKHFVYGSIDYYLRLTNFDPKYGAHHTNAKGRVNDFLSAQASTEAFTWSILNTGAYTDMLSGGLFAPRISADGIRTFAYRLGNGHLPLMTLRDVGAFALAIFSSPAQYSGRTLNVASHFATGADIAETFTRVMGLKGVYEDISFEEWIAGIEYAGGPVASTDPEGITVGENFEMWWPGFRDSVLLPTRDLEALRVIHPGLQSLEEWMREVRYDGTGKPLLKGFIDNGIGPGFEKK
ncbi:hypothetical protein BKA65DRAFT_469731 [Rhexocercosporidium sp. MPI-PUGE-AT-0058]|nr:hypothetical protein BKA65DRAFT_469731 [Rhexocercosporidium sp. MPI-PUGE-AT-0058]